MHARIIRRYKPSGTRTFERFYDSINSIQAYIIYRMDYVLEICINIIIQCYHFIIYEYEHHKISDRIE